MFKEFQNRLLLSVFFSRSGTSSTEAAIGMSFFIAKAERNNKSIELITLSMNGKLTLWHCDNLDLLTEWTSIPCGTVDSRFTNGDTGK
jgi:hypothetical protein